MKLRTLTRLSAAAALVLGVAGGVLTVLAPAGALEQERVTLTEAGEAIFDFDPIIGNNPGANADASSTIDPTVCSGVGCDVIPVTIKEPPTAEDGEFFVTVHLEWDTAEIPNVPVLGDTAVNDLDMWIQNDPLVEDAGPDEDGFAYKSAGAAEPEQVNMFSPVGDWNIMIVNASGVNTGYRLRFEVITDDLPDNIFESLPPIFSGGTAPPVRPATTIPAPTFDVAPPPTVDITPATPPVADSSFDAGFGDAGESLEDQLAAPEAVRIQPVAATRPSAPSNLALLFWMAAVPLVLVALLGAFVLRRQKGLLPGLD
jgi:hypothetical protein